MARVEDSLLVCTTYLRPARRVRRRLAVLLRAALLECEQLLRAEGLVVDVRRRVHKVTQVRAQQKVAQIHKLAVLGVLHVDDARARGAAAHRHAVYDHGVLRADHRERHEALDAAVQCALLVVIVLVVKGVGADAVLLERRADAVLEHGALLKRERISLGNDGNEVADVTKLLHHHNIDRPQRVARAGQQQRTG